MDSDLFNQYKHMFNDNINEEEYNHIVKFIDFLSKNNIYEVCTHYDIKPNIMLNLMSKFTGLQYKDDNIVIEIDDKNHTHYGEHELFLCFKNKTKLQHNVCYNLSNLLMLRDINQNNVLHHIDIHKNPVLTLFLHLFALNANANEKFDNLINMSRESFVKNCNNNFIIDMWIGTYQYESIDFLNSYIKSCVYELNNCCYDDNLLLQMLHEENKIYSEFIDKIESFYKQLSDNLDSEIEDTCKTHKNIISKTVNILENIFNKTDKEICNYLYILFTNNKVNNKSYLQLRCCYLIYAMCSHICEYSNRKEIYIERIKIIFKQVNNIKNVDVKNNIMTIIYIKIFSFLDTKCNIKCGTFDNNDIINDYGDYNFFEDNGDKCCVFFGKYKSSLFENINDVNVETYKMDNPKSSNNDMIVHVNTKFLKLFIKYKLSDPQYFPKVQFIVGKDKITKLSVDYDENIVVINKYLKK